MSVDIARIKEAVAGAAAAQLSLFTAAAESHFLWLDEIIPTLMACVSLPA